MGYVYQNCILLRKSSLLVFSQISVNTVNKNLPHPDIYTPFTAIVDTKASFPIAFIYNFSLLKPTFMHHLLKATQLDSRTHCSRLDKTGSS